MKKLLLTLAGGAAALAMAPAAQAQQTGGTADNGGSIIITGPSGTFGDDTVTAGTFTNTFTFVTPEGFNLASATISSIISGSGANTNIDFTSVTLNGVQFNTITTGASEFRNLLNQAIIPGGTNTILVSGTSGANASFSGTLSFSAVTSAVPEPATWAFMLIGFGAVGYSMRKRPAYKLAQAI